MARYISKFRGYSSIGTSFLSPVRYDLDLARQDLLNHFNTRKGERIMMPTFGSIVWDMLFEPLDDITINLIDADVRSIIKNDPRWSLQSVTISEGPNALNINVVVTYLPTEETVTLPLTYDKGTNTL
jgi:phage baseplate assembly protein W